MKVIEKGADRTGEAHIHVQGQVKPIREYGQYVDARDGAVCCYVAVEEGQKIRIEGRFSGMTLVVAYDFLVDGIRRKANSFVGKSVQLQKKKLDCETCLYQTPDGVIDTKISVAPYSQQVSLSKEGFETVGTLEMRIYITRQFDVEHEVDDACNYDHIEEHAEISTGAATYKDVPPQYHMVFEKNCSTLDASRNTRERKKIYAKRPGKEPWTTFRFHYRSKESIERRNMDLTFDPKDKSYAKKEAHTLEPEPVPMLLLGSKPVSKNDGEASVRTSSPAPSEVPSTPMKASHKSQSSQSDVAIEKQQTKLASKTTSSKSGTASSINTTSVAVTKLSFGTIADTSNVADIQTKDARDRSNFPGTPSIAPHNDFNEECATAMKDDDCDISAIHPQSVTEMAPGAILPSTNMCANNKNKQPFDSHLCQAGNGLRPERMNMRARSMVVETRKPTMVPYPADLLSAFDIPSTKDSFKNGPKSFTSPLKRVTSKPPPINTARSMMMQKPDVPPSPTTPLKRVTEGTITPPPDVKRIKSGDTPTQPPSPFPRFSTTSPGPRLQSIEVQVAEKRTQLEAMRRRRLEMARRKAVVDERLAPHKQRIAEELDRLKQEVAEEELMMAEEEQEYNASEAMLAEFEGEYGGV